MSIPRRGPDRCCRRIQHLVAEPPVDEFLGRKTFVRAARPDGGLLEPGQVDPFIDIPAAGGVRRVGERSIGVERQRRRPWVRGRAARSAGRLRYRCRCRARRERTRSTFRRRARRRRRPAQSADHLSGSSPRRSRHRSRRPCRCRRPPRPAPCRPRRRRGPKSRSGRSCARWRRFRGSPSRRHSPSAQPGVARPALH